MHVCVFALCLGRKTVLLTVPEEASTTGTARAEQTLLEHSSQLERQEGREK
jgi:hypothetical protein